VVFQDIVDVLLQETFIVAASPFAFDADFPAETNNYGIAPREETQPKSVFILCRRKPDLSITLSIQFSCFRKTLTNDWSAGYE